MHNENLFELIRKETLNNINGYIKKEIIDDIDNYIVAPKLKNNAGIIGCMEIGRIELNELSR